MGPAEAGCLFQAAAESLDAECLAEQRLDYSRLLHHICLVNKVNNQPPDKLCVLMHPGASRRTRKETSWHVDIGATGIAMFGV